MTERNSPENAGDENAGDENIGRQNLLDLLVDGELADDQRRELLAWCEREPDGWRRCALAFLEAQNWSQVFGNLTAPVRRPSTVRDSGAATRSPDSPHAPREESLVRPALWRPRQWGTMLAMAASVALAFTLGVWMRDAGAVRRFAPDGAAMRLVENKSPPQALQGRPEPGSPQTGVDAGGWSQAAGEIQLPVTADNWPMAEPSAMPDDVRRALERLGHRVEQRRQLVPYRLRDGRRVVVPVDQVEVQPVGNRSYQ